MNQRSKGGSMQVGNATLTLLWHLYTLALAFAERHRHPLAETSSNQHTSQRAAAGMCLLDKTSTALLKAFITKCLPSAGVGL